MQTPQQLIKEKLSIREVSERYLKVVPAGVNLKARCPFHNEKTASFIISPARDTFHCFGCGAHGDIFTFIEKIEGVNFPEALKILAEWANVPLPEKFSAKSATEISKKEILLKILEEATIFFEESLAENPAAKNYLLSRGVSEKTARDFRLGFAPDSFSALSNRLRSLGYVVNDLVSAGLLVERKEGDGGYDRFRSRVMFPISDERGQIVGFSGRYLSLGESQEKEVAKYVNSPEGEIFHKGKVLFGLDRAKKAIRQTGHVILVEGQMDLVMAHQAGFLNTVASSGTALTEEHLRLLKRFTDNLKIVFDGDTAGVSASIRAYEIAFGLDLDVKVSILPKDEDPAEILKKSPETFREILKNSLHPIEFILLNLSKQEKDLRRFRREVSKTILPLIKSLPLTMERAHFVRRVAEYCDLSEEAIWSDLRATQKKDIFSEKIVTEEAGEESLGENLPRHEQLKNILLSLYYGALAPKEGVFSKENFRDLLIERFGPEALSITPTQEQIFKVEEDYRHQPIVELVESLFLEEELARLKFRMNEIVRALKVFSGEKSEREKLTLEFNELTRVFSKLSRPKPK